MKSLVIFPFMPGRGARALRDSPAWIAPFVILAVVHVALLVAAERDTVRGVLAHLPPTATAADREDVAKMFYETLLTQSLFEPVRLMAGWSAFAVILTLALRALAPPGPVTYVRVLALEVHAEAALALGGIATAAFAHWAPADPGVAAGIPPWSAASFLPAASPYPLVALIASLNFFTLWYVVLLAAGMRVLFGMTIRAAALVAVSAWTLSVFFDTAILTLLAGALHLRV